MPTPVQGDQVEPSGIVGRGLLTQTLFHTPPHSYSTKSNLPPTKPIPPPSTFPPTNPPILKEKKRKQMKQYWPFSVSNVLPCSWRLLLDTPKD